MTASLGTRQYAIIALTLITAIIHFALAFMSDGAFQILFILNGLGYIVLLVCLYFVPQLAGKRSLVRYALMLFTAATFILYFVFNWPNIVEPMGLADKAVELALIILLWMDRE